MSDERMSGSRVCDGDYLVVVSVVSLHLISCIYPYFLQQVTSDDIR